MAQRLKHLPAMRETWIRSLGWEDPLEKGTATHSSILAWIKPLFLSPMHESESEVAQLCPTLHNPMDCSPPGSSVHFPGKGIFRDFPGKNTGVGCHRLLCRNVLVALIVLSAGASREPDLRMAPEHLLGLQVCIVVLPQV